MVDMPFGVSRLDSMLDGGVPTGSVVLLATEPGAGGRKFAHTSAAMNALATTDNAAFEEYYRGIDHEGVIVPATVQYLSVAATTDSVETMLTETVSEGIAASAAEGITHHDLSASYFASTAVPSAWYQRGDGSSLSLPSAAPDAAGDGTAPTGDTVDAAGDGTDTQADDAEPTDPFDYGDTAAPVADSDTDETAANDTPDTARDPSTNGDAGTADTHAGSLDASSGILSTLRRSLDAAVGGNLVVVDAITDLDDLPAETVSWAAVVRLLRGLTRLVAARGGLVLVVADAEAVTDPQLGSLSAATTGTLSFRWETGGSQRARMLAIEELPGALDRLDRDEIAAFESELHDRGYDLSNVRKIR